MTEQAIIKPKRRLPLIWILPLLALIAAAWMIYKTELSKGPLITIEFENAEGLQANKTKIKCRSVDIGMVEKIALNKDFSKAYVKARINKGFTDLLKEDCRIWVEKPRIGNRGISGMGTILSGAYIELEPGKSATKRVTFIGLSEPPVLTPDPDGIVVELLSEDASSLSPGDPVIFHGFTVGTILDAQFDSKLRRFSYQAYVEPPYKELLCDSTRFWNASGISINYGVDGLEMDASTLESIISGGVSFDVPEGMKPGHLCDQGHQFKLYDNYDDILEQPYNHYAEYTLLFNSSIAGLKSGAPVEYRGFQIGSVVEVAPFDMEKVEEPDLGPVPMPVIIRIDPARFELEDSAESVAEVKGQMATRVALGMRAMMETRNFLTGSRFITFEYFENAEHATMGSVRGMETLPTISSGFEHIEKQIAQLLTKLNKLELEEALEDIREFTDNFDTTLSNIDSFVTSEQLLKLPEQLNTTMQQLETTLAGLDPSSRFYEKLESLLEEVQETARLFSDYGETLNHKPNAIIFSGSRTEDPTPDK